MSSQLFSPINFRDLKLSNRILLSPMCQYAATDGCAGDWHLMHLGQYMVSGVGMTMIEMTNVEARGRITPYCLGLFDDNCEAALDKVMRYCRQLSDTPIAIQLAHAGRKASCLSPWQGRKRLSVNEGGWKTVGPSSITHNDQVVAPDELSLTEIEGLVEAFVSAAVRADRLGIDAIELHAAHGYLLHQFLSPLSNQRQDDYGGSRDNRMRFPLQVFDAVRAVWPASKPLGIRLSALDWMDGGLTLDDSTYISAQFVKRACDWIDVSSGGISYAEKIETGPGYQVGFSGQIRKATAAKTIAVGMITEAEQAESIIQTGQADMVALARGLLFNPRWAWHAAIKLGEEFEYPDRYQRCAPANMNAF
ncbi:MAG: 2,4-dienoyl-CoA reductase-like NADH-dependent reductase (Old Yellow Enzyme family) [Gammaproteobacteria bacterium]|jgi:2,4-dienoyl-CoA reductase-like NADH-dependent reductase (Old Yellow Enzyme family)